MSGVIYTIERVISYYKWSVNIYMVVSNKSGGYNSQPDRVHLSNNYFILLFLLIGLSFYISACLSLLKKYNLQKQQQNRNLISENKDQSTL